MVYMKESGMIKSLSFVFLFVIVFLGVVSAQLPDSGSLPPVPSIEDSAPQINTFEVANPDFVSSGTIDSGGGIFGEGLSSGVYVAIGVIAAALLALFIAFHLLSKRKNMR